MDYNIPQYYKYIVLFKGEIEVCKRGKIYG